jgi:L-fuculose-phosphate aldolase
MHNIHEIKDAICEIGDRLYKRGFAAANDGNITVRLNENEVLCTPTMVCKGFLKPDDICTIDIEGNQLAGKKKRSSEALLHLEIMKARPDVQSVVHCHPPHATAFAIAREPIPQAVLPEVEFYLGDVPIAKYETPGGKKFAETILPYVHKTYTIILANHGTVSYADSLELAYWRTEILDSYCRVLILARQLGPINYLSSEHTRELINLKQNAGFADPRGADDFQGDIRRNATFRHTWSECGVAPRAFPEPPAE